MQESSRYSILNRCSRLCLWLNVFLMAFKLSLGYSYQSKALFADGVHSLMDVTADLFVIYAVYMSNRPRDDQHPYGYSRYETLGNIVISFMLLAASYAIIQDAIIGVKTPGQEMSWVVGGAAIVSIILNEVSFQYVKSQAQKIKSDLLMSTAVHQRADAATSFIVLSATIASFYQVRNADIVGAVCIAILIAYYALPSLINSVGELLDKGMSPENVQRIKSAIHDVEGVVDHHFLRSRRMAEKGYVDVHVVVSSKISVSEGHYIGDQVESVLLGFPDIIDVTVHIDAEDDRETKVVLPPRSEIEGWLRSAGVKYDHLVIHYLNDLVDIEVYLSDGVETSISDSKPKWLNEFVFFSAIK
ncbi:MAG: cation diffusion facilitator family transporter [Pseudomonadota bacterium]|nr:cation diffusion facilitator family transporter [Pseudomonadota bacterium]